jgi:hypothetical protein
MQGQLHQKINISVIKSAKARKGEGTKARKGERAKARKAFVLQGSEGASKN